jgi:hypothetical protein
MVPEPAWLSDPVMLPGDDVAVYEVIVAPPSEAGAVYVTVAVVAPVAVAVPIVGALGTVLTTTTAIALELTVIVVVAEPEELVAVTVYTLEEDVAVVVPLITPVEVLNERPEGSGELMLQDVAASPVFVGVSVVIAVPTVALMVDGE